MNIYSPFRTKWVKQSPVIGWTGSILPQWPHKLSFGLWHLDKTLLREAACSVFCREVGSQHNPTLPGFGGGKQWSSMKLQGTVHGTDQGVEGKAPGGACSLERWVLGLGITFIWGERLISPSDKLDQGKTHLISLQAQFLTWWKQDHLSLSHWSRAAAEDVAPSA